MTAPQDGQDAQDAPDGPDATGEPDGPDEPDAHGEPAQPPAPWTPRIEVLRRQAREHMEEERIRLADDWSRLRRQSIEHQRSLDHLRQRAMSLEEKQSQARHPLSDVELATRRLAEQDANLRPDTFVAARRQATWERRLNAAEASYQTATAELARATHSFTFHEDLIRERAAVARAAARRHHELAFRRIATYLQQLVRSHPRGPELNNLLREYRVGPDLPDWAKEPADGQSGVERMLDTTSAVHATGPGSSNAGNGAMGR